MAGAGAQDAGVFEEAAETGGAGSGGKHKYKFNSDPAFMSVGAEEKREQTNQVHQGASRAPN